MHSWAWTAFSGSHFLCCRLAFGDAMGMSQTQGVELWVGLHWPELTELTACPPTEIHKKKKKIIELTFNFIFSGPCYYYHYYFFWVPHHFCTRLSALKIIRPTWPFKAYLFVTVWLCQYPTSLLKTRPPTCTEKNCNVQLMARVQTDRSARTSNSDSPFFLYFFFIKSQ